jgi:beta-galactosidase
MVAKDYNHPCVVLYSIGNEIPDVGKPNGRNWGRKLADKIRSLDATRFTMNSVNALLAAQDVLIKFVKQMAQAPKAVPSAEPEGRGSPPEGSDVNSTMSSMDGVMAMIFQIPEVAQSLEEAYACVDVAGYNYAESQYEGDGKKYPDRVILGSEDFPKDIALNWALTERLPFVIGDFTWTAWEYLGESGIAKISYGTPAGASLGSMADYPYLVSSTGDIDITGFRRPVSYWREVVWGKRKAPYIAVLKPEHYGEKPNAGNWSWSDSESSWTWPGFEGKPVQLEVYSNADEVALLLNGKELARKAVSRDGEKDKSDAFKAVFDTVYTPGKLEAVAFSGGTETGRYALETAEKVAQIKADSEKGSAASGQGTLFFINLALCDSEGRVNTAASEKIKLSLDGPGVLQGFGSGAPATEESFCSDEQTPFYGRAFAVVRATGDGKITVKAEAEGLPVTEVVLA